jgi:large subunit ribosomal protein L24
MSIIVEKGRVDREGVNIITKTTKPSAQYTKGGILKKKLLSTSQRLFFGMQKKEAPTKVKTQRDNGKLVRISKNQRRLLIMST